eukprot:SAG31_NODE_31994_length_361_cov_0.984733_1_plen_36_part_10
MERWLTRLDLLRNGTAATGSIDASADGETSLLAAAS